MERSAEGQPEPATGLTEVLARRFLTTDAARPEKVAKWHGKGRRTARENIADLVDAGSFVEYGRFVTAAQESRRPLAELVVEAPADGIIGGTATIAGRPCAVLSYDYLVMAGTQGMRGHRKSDRLIEIIGRLRLPTVFFTEGGGGRPGDVDLPLVSALDVGSFALWGELEGVVPRIAVVSGRCFAGNAVLAGCADLRIATPDANLGMAGPAMIAGGGLGQYAAEEIGPVSEQAANGVLDIVVEDEEAAVDVVRRILALLAPPHPRVVPPGPSSRPSNTADTSLPNPRVGLFEQSPSQRDDWAVTEGRLGGIRGTTRGDGGDQTALRTMLPENDREGFDVRPVVEALADLDSVIWLKEAYAPELVTALGRIEGLPVGIIANQSTHLAGALTTDASAKAADFLQLCERWRIPVVSLVDTPGFMVGPEAERTGLVRQASRMVNAGARLTVPLVGVVLRRGYGLGAQAMLGGSTHRPLLTVAWPGAHLGAMGLEGAVRLSLAHELAALPEDEREAAVVRHTAELRKNASALNAARVFEIDDVIDPAETRGVIGATLRACGGSAALSE